MSKDGDGKTVGLKFVYELSIVEQRTVAVDRSVLGVLLCRCFQERGCGVVIYEDWC